MRNRSFLSVTARRGGRALSLLAMLLVPSLAAAAPTSGEKAQADALFREARALMTAGSTTEACGKFAESQRLDPQLGTRLNLALCHAKEGKTASAWVELREVSELADRVKDAERAQFARQQADLLEKKLSHLRVVVGRAPPRALVLRLDGEVLGASALGSALPVDPGEHTIEASAPGRRTWTQTTRIEGATTVDLTVPELDEQAADTVVAVTSPRDARTTEKVADESRAPVLGYVLGGAGIVALGVGTIFGLQTLSKKSDADAECPNDVCTAAGHDLESDARTASIVSTIGFGVGLIGVVAGAFLIITAKPGPRRSTASTQTAVRFVSGARGVRVEAAW